jgi:Helix-turn-helix domain
MSIKVMTNVWQHSEAAGTGLLVLLALADIADDNGECWPSMGYVARKCRIDSRTAQRQIRSLEKLGEVIVIVGGGKTSTAGGTRSNRYRIVVHVPAEGGELPGGGKSPHHDTSAGEGVAPVSGGGVAPVSPDTSVRSVNDTSLVPASPKRTRQRSAQVPEDFTVTHEMRVWCESQSIRSDPMTETEKFIDHWRSKGDTRIDWVSSWRNWMRNADKWAKPAAAKGRSASAIALIREQVFSPPNVIDVPAIEGAHP